MHDLRGTQNPRRSRIVWIIVFFMASIYPVFLWLADRALAFVLVGFALAVVVGKALCSRSRGYGPLQAVLVAVAVVATIGILAGGGPTWDQLFLLTALALGFFLSFLRQWYYTALYVINILLATHAVGTIIFFAYPEWHTVFMSFTNIGNFVTALDYRSGITADYSYNGMYNSLGFVIAGVLTVFSRTRRTMIAFGVMASVFLFALLLTSKRGPLLFATLSVIITLVVLGRLRSDRKRDLGSRGAPIVLVGMAFGVGMAVFMATSDAASGAFDRTFGTGMDLNYLANGRFALWSAAIDNWREAPMFGSGWGSFRVTWSLGRGVYTSVAAHNVFLNLLAETGIAGTCVVMSMGLLAGVTTISLIRRLRDNPVDALEVRDLAASLAVQIFFWGYALVANPLYDPPTIYCYILSIAASCRYRERDGREVSSAKATVSSF